MIFTALLLYIQITSVTVFTNDEIVCHSFYHPNAQKYKYADIRLIQAGAYDKYIPFIRYKGDFYYIITFKDGTRINLMDIGAEASGDAYLQVEHIDKIIMANGVKKISSENNIELSGMDKVYINRFKGIIENK